MGSDERDSDTRGTAENAGAGTSHRRNRTAAAWREFVVAARADIASVVSRLRRAPATERPRTVRAGYRRLSYLVFGGLAGLGVGALGLSGAMLWALNGMPADLPAPDLGRPAILLEAADGSALGRVGPMHAAVAAREEFPEHVVQAVLSIEDRRFYQHLGIDPIGIARALRANAQAGKIVEGGSTITQQVVKMEIGNDRTYTRKLREALRAVWLELSTGKDEILQRYLNTVYMGGGAHGLPAAARLYFGKEIADVTLAEAAMLAGVIQAPSKFNPLSNAEVARARAEIVIDAMLANGVIDAKAAEDAKARPAMLRATREVQQAGSWFADWVAQETASITGPYTRRIRVRTTLSPPLQALAERLVAEEIINKQDGRSASQAALVAMRPDGAVLAMVGGLNYDDSQFNRATEANRHPGSTFKMFVYGAALLDGRSLDDIIDAGPVNIKGWRPENFGGEVYGRMPLAEAFARSVNTAAVRLAMDVGLDKVAAVARDLGIDARLQPMPSLALGAVEISLLDLTGAFASVRANRKRLEPWGISGFAFDDQARLRTLGPHAGSEPLGAYQEQLVELLRLVVERGTGRAAAVDGFVAGKTGTSQEHRDAWFIGFTDSLVVGVWVGNDDGSPMERVVGGTLPANIWRRFVSEASGLIGREETPVASAPALETRPADVTQPTNAEILTQSTSIREVAPAASSGGRAECDYRACTDAYRSFRASDCTYQPYSGSRAICTLGNDGGQRLQAQQREPVADTHRSEARGEMQCNVDVCAQFYNSFDSSDCSYQPYDGGPRQLCER